MTGDLNERLTALEKEVRAEIQSLHERIDELEQQRDRGSVSAEPGAIDRYDATVLQLIEDRGITWITPSKVKKLYNEAGIRDRNKIKQRHKFLDQSSRLQEALDAAAKNEETQPADQEGENKNGAQDK